MKQQPVLFFVLLLCCALTSCNQKEKKAKAYHDDILRSVQVVIDSSLNFGDGVQSYQKVQATIANSHYTTLINSTIEKLNAAKDFDGDTTLAHYSLEMLTFYKTALERDFAPVLNSVKADAFSDEEKQHVDSLYQDFAMMEAKYWERFNWAEKKFYKEHDIARVDK